MLHYVGQQVAAVAAADRKTALLALAAIKVDYETLPSVIGADAARKAGAPVLFPGGKGQKVNAGEGPSTRASWSGNVRGPSAAFSQKKKSARDGSPRRGPRAIRLLFEGTFRTGVQQHTCLEPHVAIAHFDGDRLTVHVSTQFVFELKTKIAKRFKLAAGQGAGRRRAHRRRIRIEGRARRRDDRRDQARESGQGAGPGRVQPARGTVGRGISSGG